MLLACSLQVIAKRNQGIVTATYTNIVSQIAPLTLTPVNATCLLASSPVEIDCTEVANHLDPSTCTCVSNPSYVGIYDNDLYALGCPRSFDTVFAGQLRILEGCAYPGAQYGDWRWQCRCLQL
jgi:hypothetical protein